MPPKKNDKAGGGSSSKVAVDKTFGMKNKKGGKGQAAVALAKQQAAQVGKNKEAMAKEKAKLDKEKEREQERKRKTELNDIFKPVQVAQKVPFGTDPKTVLCQYFKAGTCDKSSKCKFSHDLNVDRKTTKKDLYTDARDPNKETDTMDTWDDDKLQRVVLSKQGNPKTTTDIVCKNFIEAIETGKYGWFWECPSGGDNCKYRHALPPGFVLKSQKKKAQEDAKKNEISIEDFLESERHKLGKNLTPVTKETFAKWKAERLSRKQVEEESKRKIKEQQAAAGRMNGMSGRDLFTYDTTGVYGDDAYSDDGDDDDEGGDDWDLLAYRKETENEQKRLEEERISKLTGALSEAKVGD
ncbi:mRNA export protein 33 [Phakopsora pachyrhizi]|uniref:mRNA export protein 33 n=1 Tax=Phakopsora pachyrhizi TaxID=170000 RepID=A0AAV0BJN2_PHAPC|nr:mRNA export protein 33 [Phakopsora pachyrhizi]CAH7685743.1 mRNA export protein 33 [Phakopsora pachyrhizi]